MNKPEQYWFPAKRYGWGWGFPVTWQGWVALLVVVALLIAGLFLFPPAHRPLSFLVYTVLTTFVFGLVCYAKGEPPSWHRGKK